MTKAAFFVGCSLALVNKSAAEEILAEAARTDAIEGRGLPWRTAFAPQARILENGCMARGDTTRLRFEDIYPELFTEEWSDVFVVADECSVRIGQFVIPGLMCGVLHPEVSFSMLEGWVSQESKWENLQIGGLRVNMSPLMTTVDGACEQAQAIYKDWGELKSPVSRREHSHNALERHSRAGIETQLVNACREGNFENAKELVAQGADVNAKEGGRTPLVAAIESRSLEIAEFLIGSGADVNQRDDAWGSVLVRCVDTRQVACVKLLLDSGADVNMKPMGEHPKALPYAVILGEVELARLLIDRGAIVDESDDTDESGKTPLMTASMPGNIEMMKLLLEKGADVNARDRVGETPLMIAAYWDQVDAAALLLEQGASIEAQRADGQTALMIAAGEGQANVVRLLLVNGADPSAQDTDGQTSLSLAVECGLDDVAALLRSRLRRK
jgi:ankyrin repeat protein